MERLVRILREGAIPAGSLLIVVAIIASTVTPAGWRIWAIGGTGAVLLLAGLVLDRERVLAALRGRRARAAGASIGYSLTVIAVLVLVNVLAARYHLRRDLTETQAFTLSEQTIKVLESLPRDVQITYFYTDVQPGRQKLEDLLKEYRIRSRRLSTRMIDPDKNPGDAKRYGISEYGTIVVESGKQESRTTAADEESLTNAILKVTRDRERIVYVTTGHGERGLEDADRGGLSLLKTELEKQHYAVRPLVLTQGVPADASVVLVAGARKPFLDAEARMIRDHVEGGGRLLLLQDPETGPGLAGLLEAYGLRVRDDVVVDKVSQLFGGDALIPMVPGNGYDEFHPITKTFRFQTFFPLASSVEIAADLPEGVVATRLAQTSEYSWGETSREEIRSGRIALTAGPDVRGPLVIAATAQRRLPSPAAGEAGEGKEGGERPPDRETRLVVFGDSDFLSNAYFNASGNGDLALSAIAWLAEQEELVSIRPKTTAPRLVILTPGEIFFYFWSIVALAPVVIVVAGVAIWVRRRKL
jgi:ABC-type uncharacterized transport system involved in gliding motility auxiliary subunit